MKNNFAKAVIVVPLALSVSFGVVACSQISVPSAPVVQEQEIDSAALKTNIVGTVESLKNVILDPVNVKYFQEWSKISNNSSNSVDSYETFDADGKIWEQIAPFADFPTDDEGLKNYVFGNNDTAANHTAKSIKTVIIVDLIEDFLDFELDGPDLKKLDKFMFDYSSAQKMSDGVINLKNQSMIIKDSKGVITEIREMKSDLKFSSDGKKFSYDKNYLATAKDSVTLDALETGVYALSSQLANYIREKTHVDNVKNFKKADIIEIAEKMNMDSAIGGLLTVDFDEKTKTFTITMTDPKDDKLKVSYDSKTDTTTKPSHTSEYRVDLLESNKVLETFETLTDLKPDNFAEEIKYLINVEEEVNRSKGQTELIKIYKSAKPSDDKKSVKVTIDGQAYKFAFIDTIYAE